MPVPTTREDEQRYLAKSVALAQRCGARNGDLLAHISTADTARDLDYLRSLVGDSRLSFLGESTGTFLGQTYCRSIPASASRPGSRCAAGEGAGARSGHE